MLSTILLLIFLSFCLGTGVWLFFLHAVRRGDFDDIEGPKYRMLEDDGEDESSSDGSPDRHDQKAE